MTDFTRSENEKLTLGHLTWMGFINLNGAMVKDGFEGEVQYVNGNFWYCKGNEAIKKLEINKDINDIYLAQIKYKGL
jgi:hypothetical protein